jgi:predicted outer membrane repeat protein
MMSAAALLTLAVLTLASCGQKSWFVSAMGDDANKGSSEKKPFKTLGKALIAAASSRDVHIVTVLGTLNADSEGRAQDATFLISPGGSAEITIAGKTDAEEHQKAILSGAAKPLLVVRINGAAPVRFENIEISGGRDQQGINVDSSTLTLGPGTVVKDHTATGIVVNKTATLVLEEGSLVSGNTRTGINVTREATLIMEGGEISGNHGIYEDRGNRVSRGGGVFVSGTFTMRGGTITGNEAVLYRSSSWGENYSSGGGVYNTGTFILEGGEIIANASDIWGGGVGNTGTFTMTGGRIADNTAKSHHGGVRNSGTFTLEGGEISGNTSERSGGGVGNTGTFTMTGGTISGNTAKQQGGGIRNDGTFTLENGTITGNTAAGGGGISGRVTQNGGDVSGNTPDDIR